MQPVEEVIPNFLPTHTQSLIVIPIKYLKYLVQLDLDFARLNQERLMRFTNPNKGWR